MKNPGLKIALHIFLLLFSFNLFSQDVVIQSLPDGIEPVIDGTADLLWEQYDSIFIETEFIGELPSISKAFWQATWNDEAIFIKVEVLDDYHCDYLCSNDEVWMSDRIELYFDVNKEINDGLGPSQQYSGHYQISPQWVDGEDQYAGEFLQWEGSRYYTGYNISDSGYIYEYKIYNYNFRDKYDNLVSPWTMDSLGFDVVIVDRDSANDTRRRLVWKNKGQVIENWNNCDDAGRINLPNGFYSEEPCMLISSNKRAVLDSGSVYIMEDVPTDLTIHDTIYIKNLGETDLIISSVGITGEYITLTALDDFTLSKNEILRLHLSFSSDVDSIFNEEIEIISNNPENDTIILGIFQRCLYQYFQERSDFELEAINFSGSLEWGDYDNDGDLDLLTSNDLYKNDLPDSVWFTKQDQFGIPEFSYASWADIDNDGDLDILGSGFSSAIYKNDLPDLLWFTELTDIDIPYSWKSAIKGADLNNDGSMDFILTGQRETNESETHLYWQIDNEFIEDEFIFRGGNDIALFDYNNDNYTDIIISGGDDVFGGKRTTIYKNETASSNGFSPQHDIELPRVHISSVEEGDYNADGKLDILVTGYGDLHGCVSKVFKNIGDGFELDSLIELPGVWNGGSSWGDYDIDGDLDILLVGGNNNGEKFGEVHRNYLMEMQEFDRILSYNLINATGGACDFGDFDGDGDLDMVMGGNTNEGDKVIIYENLSQKANTAPLPPQNIDYRIYESSVVLTWDEGSDVETATQSLSYNVKIRTETNEFVLPVHSDTASGYRKIPEWGNAYLNKQFTLTNLDLGTYYFSVQTIDNGYMASDFSDEMSFQILPAFAENPLVDLSPVIRSTLALGDYNNDDYLDIVFIGKRDNKEAKIFTNQKDGTFTDTSMNIPDLDWGSADWGDYDNDGDLDVLITGANTEQDPQTILYRNNLPDSSGFSIHENLGFNKFSYGSSKWGDYDNDGDLDFIISGFSENSGLVTEIYRNNNYGADGFTLVNDTTVAGVYFSSFSWGDYDKDNDLDLLMNGKRGTTKCISYVFKNKGNGDFEILNTINLSAASTGAAIWGDYDSDGDLDILVAGIDPNVDPVMEIHRNDGDDVFENIYIDIKKVINSSVCFGDYNNDGFMDLVYSGASGAYGTKVYKNNKDDTFSEIETSLAGVSFCTTQWGDYNNDGSLDIVLSGSSSAAMYLNNTNEPNSAPTAPENLEHELQGFDVLFSWDEAYDPDYPEGSVYYNLRIGTSPGTEDILSSNSNLSNGNRKIPFMGNVQCNTSWIIKNIEPDRKYYWSVQAVDQSLKGGPWSEIDSFIVTQVSPEFTFDTVCMGEQTTFLDQSVTTDVLNAWEWDFGDGSSSSLQNPVHQYASADTFDVIQWVYTESGDSAMQTYEVIVKGVPEADFLLDEVCLGSSTEINNTTITNNLVISEWNWSFGDGETSVLEDPVEHKYLAEGSYSIQLSVLAATGCSSNITKSAVVGEIPDADINLIGNVDFCGGDSVILSTTKVDGYEYQWKTSGANISGADTSGYIAKASGSFTVEVTNPSGNCVSLSDEPVVISVSPSPENPYIQYSGPDTFCSGDTAFFSIAEYANSTYQWKLNGGAVGSSSTNYKATATGSYSVEVRNEYGCLALSSNSIDLTFNPAPAIPTLGIGGEDEFCEGDSISLSVTNNPDVDYQWINTELAIAGENTNTIWVKESGNYSLKISNEYGCEVQTEQMTAVANPRPEPPVLSYSGNNWICSGDSVAITTAEYIGIDFQWTLNGGPVGENKNTFVAKSSGDYQLIISNEFSCEVSSDSIVDVHVQENPVAPAIGIDGQTVFCDGDDVRLSVNFEENIEYEWLSDVSIDPGPFTNEFYAKASGTYSLRLTNDALCSSQTEEVSITVNPSPAQVLISYSGTTSFCEGESLALSVAHTEGYTYRWTLNGGTIGSDTSQIIAVNSGTYNVIASNSFECTAAAIEEVDINVLPSPVIPVISISGDTVICEGESSLLSVEDDPDLTYQWRNAQLELSDANSNSFQVVASGNYSVSVTNLQECSKSSQALKIEVNETPQMPEIVVDGSTEFCEGGSMEMTITPYSGVRYDWLRDETPRYLDTERHSATESGTYKVRATNEKGCSSYSSQEITVTVYELPGIPTLGQKGLNAFCEGDTTLVLSAPEPGQNSYQWLMGGSTMFGETNAQLTINESGSYSLHVSTANLCAVTTDEITVTVNPYPEKPLITSANYTMEDCPSMDPIILEVENITQGASYQWYRSGELLSGADSTILEGYLSEGVYKVEAELGECSYESSALTISFPDMPEKPTIIPEGPIIWYLACSNDTASAYKWYYNDAEISGADEYIYLANDQLGKYEVAISENGGCFAVSDPIWIPQGTDVRDNPWSGLKIYPNPTPGLFTLEMNNSIMGELVIDIYGETGANIINIKFEKVSSFFRTQIDLSAQPAAIYLIGLMLNEYQTTRTLIIE